MQAPLRSRLHFHTGQASPKADRASRLGWSELDNSHLVVRLNINVSMKSHLISSSFARKQVSASRASALFHHAEPEMGCSRCLKRSEVFSNLCDDILRGICLVKNSIHPRMRKNFSNRALFPTTSARPV